MEFWVEFLAKLARAAGTGCVETIYDRWVNMLHGKGSWVAKTDSPGYEAATAFSLIFWSIRSTLII
jgi:hypothetical protein